MIVKVCGMTDADNILEMVRLPVDIIGLVFYKASPRAVNPANQKLAEMVHHLDTPCAGIFVDEEFTSVLSITNEFGLSIIQLHGDESPEFCRALRINHRVIKAVHLQSGDDILQLEKYHGTVDWFLFDTMVEAPGGTGKKFNWDLLAGYHLPVPFFLSGGIGPGDESLIREIQWSYFLGVDLNSRFEIRPGLKDISLIRTFLHNIK